MTIAASPPFDFYKRFRALAYLLVLLAVGGFAFAEGNPATFILIAVAAAISWWIVEGPRGKGFPRAFVNIGVLGTAFFLVYEVAFDGGSSRDASPNLLLILGHFMTGILVCKFFERKTNRDYAQMLTLTLLIMVAAAIFSASMLFAVILVIYLALALYAVMLLHLRAETEAAITGRLLPTERSFLADVFLKRDIRRVASWSTLLLVAIAIAVFLAIPRTRGQGMLNGWSANATFRTGFSDRVRLGEYGQLQQDDHIVMEVKLEQNDTNIGSEYLQPYFRGIALDTYDGLKHEWVRSNHYDPANVPDYDVTPTDPAHVRSDNDFSSTGLITQHYSLQINAGNILFTMAPAVRIESDALLPITFCDRDDELLVRGQQQQPLQYTVVSALVARPDPLEPPRLIPGFLGYSNQGWNVDNFNVVPAEISTLARELIKDIAPNGRQVTDDQIRVVAERYSEYLRNNYPYTLTMQPKDRRLDPTADFLLNRKDTGGHCEDFASAMVMLCRSVGINARMVTGYHGGEYNAISGAYVVRQKYSHAWTEVYFPGRGWVTFDPSPAAGEALSELPFVHWFRDFAEIIQRGWLSSIIGFDNSSRSYIFDTIGSFFGSISDYLHQRWNDAGISFNELLFSRNSPWSDRFLGAGSTVFILGMIFWLTYRWNRRRTSPIVHILRKVDRKIHRQLAQDLLFFDELLRILARTGSRKSAEQTPREYVEKLAPRLRTAAADARWLVGTFYEVRFGTTRITSPLRTQIAHALTNVRHELHNHS